MKISQGNKLTMLSFLDGDNENRLDDTRQSTTLEIVLWAIIGAVCFFLIYGVRPLIFTDDRWILNLYVERDVIQHYSGWMAFRNSDWLYPIGRFDSMSGGIVTYTDSIPWIAILFKLIRGILPKTFQYFGLYIFLAFILQGIAAGKLLKLFIDDRKAVALGVVLFCFSPIMIERAFRHTALASHYLILFSLYFLFKSYKCKRMSLWYIPISVVTIGIHPYFLPIVFSIIGTNVLYLLCYGRKTFFYNCCVLVCSLVLTVFAGYFIGALGSSSLGADGYGHYSMNINALYNPTSCGGIKWSYILPVAPQILGNYDGFNYLGLGMLFGIPICTFYFGKSLKLFLRKYWSILAVAIFMTLFAISNTMTFNNSVIFEYPLPESFFSFASIFRASSRMFYPVYYLIFLGIVISIYRVNTKGILLLLLLIIQIWDMTPAIRIKKDSFTNAAITANFENNSWYNDERLNELSNQVDTIYPLEYIWNYQFAAWGLKNDVNINVYFASSHYAGNEESWPKFSDSEQQLIDGELAQNSAFVTTRKDLVDEMLFTMPDVYKVYYICELYFIVDKEIELKGENYISEVSGYSVSDLTDENWTNGILNGTDNTLLFTFSKLKENVIKNASFLIVDNNKYRIESVEVLDNQWIRVTIHNLDHHNIEYPMQVTFE